MANELNTLPQLSSNPIVSTNGSPTPTFMGYINNAFASIQTSITNLGVQLGLIQAAQSTADQALTEAEAAQIAAAASQAAADAAQDAADAATADAAALEAVIDRIGADNILSQVEKKRTIREVADLLAEQSDIVAKANLYGITTERTNYQNSITTLTTYLATLTTPVAWNNVSDVTNIVGTTFRTRFSDVLLARQIVLNRIADVAKSQINSIPLGNANRVPFSRMEGDRGWGIAWNPNSLTITQEYNIFQGMRFYRLSTTATAANQTISLGTAPVSTTAAAFRLTPGERISVQTRVESAGAAANGWTLNLWGFRADGSNYPIPAEAGSVTNGGNRSIGSGFIQFFVTVPGDVIGGRLELYGFTSGAGSLQLVISEPMVTSAAATQTAHPPFSPGPNALDAADVTAFVTGPFSQTFTYTATGVIDPSNQLPRNLTYRFNTLNGPLGSGVSWSYRVITGSVNGFTASATLRSMSGTGEGTFTLTSFESNTADIEILGVAGGQLVTGRLALIKSFAAPNNSGGGGGGSGTPATASQSSGFTYIPSSQTSFGTISNTLTVTSGTTTKNVSVTLEIWVDQINNFTNTNFEVILERWNGSAWVQMGATELGQATYYFDNEPPPGGFQPIFNVDDPNGTLYEAPAYLSFTRSVTVTSNTQQQVRLRARRSGGTARGGSVFGTFTLSA